MRASTPRGLRGTLDTQKVRILRRTFPKSLRLLNKARSLGEQLLPKPQRRAPRPRPRPRPEPRVLTGALTGTGRTQRGALTAKSSRLDGSTGGPPVGRPVLWLSSSFSFSFWPCKVILDYLLANIPRSSLSSSPARGPKLPKLPKTSQAQFSSPLSLLSARAAFL